MTDFMFYILDTKRLEPAGQAMKWLGRITQFYDQPGAKFTPSVPFDLIKDHVKVSVLSSVDEAVKSSRNRTLRAKLTKIAGLDLQTNVDRTIHFRTSTILTVRLENYDQVFAKLKTREDVGPRLKELMPKSGHGAYMIVGLLIWTDARFAMSHNDSSIRIVDLTAPTGTVAAAAGAGSATDAANLELSRDAQDDLAIRGRGFSPGSSIFAFEYKLVRRTLPSYIIGFDATITDHGPRFRADQVFSGGKTPAEQSQKDDDAGFELENDAVVWTDIIDETGLEEETTGDVTLVFHLTPG